MTQEIDTKKITLRTSRDLFSIIIRGVGEGNSYSEDLNVFQTQGIYIKLPDGAAGAKIIIGRIKLKTKRNYST